MRSGGYDEEEKSVRAMQEKRGGRGVRYRDRDKGGKMAASSLAIRESSLLGKVRAKSGGEGLVL